MICHTLNALSRKFCVPRVHTERFNCLHRWACAPTKQFCKKMLKLSFKSLFMDILVAVLAWGRQIYLVINNHRIQIFRLAQELSDCFLKCVLPTVEHVFILVNHGWSFSQSEEGMYCTVKGSICPVIRVMASCHRR